MRDKPNVHNYPALTVGKALEGGRLNIIPQPTIIASSHISIFHIFKDFILKNLDHLKTTTAYLKIFSQKLQL